MALAFNIKAQDIDFKNGFMHGGILNTAGDYKIEVINSYRNFIVYLYDKNNKPIPNKDITGEVSFYYNHDASINLKLNAGENQSFTAEVKNANYYYCVVSFNIYGKPVSSKFFNLAEIAKKKK